MAIDFLKAVTGACLSLLLIYLSSCSLATKREIKKVGEAHLSEDWLGSSGRFYGSLSDTSMAFFNLTNGISIQLTKGSSFQSSGEIKLPNDLKGRIFSFYISNNDSILEHEVYLEYNRLKWINKKGEVLQSYAINTLLEEEVDTYTRSATPLIVHNNTATVFFGRNQDPDYYQKNSKLPLAIRINLISHQNDCMFAQYPSAYQNKDYHFNTSHNRPFVVQLTGDTSIWGFHATPEIQMYKGCKLIKSKDLPSAYIDKVPGFPLEHYGKMAEELSFGHSSPAYSRMHYNPWQRLVYRINLPAQKYKNDDGSFNLHENRKFSIQVFDTELNLISEKLIEDPMDFESAFAGPLGLYIRQKQDESNTYFIYSLLN